MNLMYFAYGTVVAYGAAVEGSVLSDDPDS